MRFYIKSDFGNTHFNFEDIIKKAEVDMHLKPLHITDYLSASSLGNLHDYYSNGDYWWPNPDTDDGLPYVRRDGEKNPNNFNMHQLALRTVRSSVANLAAAYHITNDEKYSEKAVILLKEFFLDQETKMNPHLLYAQAIPGISTGRCVGLIDTLHSIDIPVAIDVLTKSPHMKPEILSGLKKWFAEYLEWLTTHEFGLEEMQAGNNHGVCWCIQVAVFGLFTGNQKNVDFIRERYKTVLLPDQMAMDGSFPKELERTNPYGYSTFIIDNMIILCHILSTPQDDLWNFELPDGRNIQKGLEFFYPYIADISKWPYSPDVAHFDQWPVAVPFMLFAGYALSDKKYIDLWEKLYPTSGGKEVMENGAIRQPILWLL